MMMFRNHSYRQCFFQQSFQLILILFLLASITATSGFRTPSVEPYLWWIDGHGCNRHYHQQQQQRPIQLVLPLGPSLSSSIMAFPFENIRLNLTAKTVTADDSFIRFLSSTFVFAKHEPDDGADLPTTVEYKSANHSEYYSNDLIEEICSGAITNRSSSSSSSTRRLCQLFIGDERGSSKQQHRATLSICNDGTMTGIITLKRYGGHLILEPDPDPGGQHCQSPNGSNKIPFCHHRIRFINEIYSKKNHRSKRSYSLERTIEILVVTDHSMNIYHGDSLRNYVFALMAMVSHLFEHSSIGNEINIKLVKLISLSDPSLEQEAKTQLAHETLQQFCRWQNAHNFPSDDHPMHHDTAILLTKIDLCSKVDLRDNEIGGDRDHTDHHHHHSSRPKSSKPSCVTLGLAHSGQMCDPASSCAIIEDNGLSAAFTITHELGHLLGVPHDDEEQCKKFYAQRETSSLTPTISSGQYKTSRRSGARRPESNVMVRMIDANSNMWSWSACSKYFITEFLDSGKGDCLLDNNSVDIREDSKIRKYDTYQRRDSYYAIKNWIEKLSRVPAGALYSADAQCQLMFNKNSSVCLEVPYCKRLWCTNDNGGCRTQHMPWADGTECGDGFWCQEGECVRMDRTTHHPVDGEWEEWSPWSKCSRECGGGIRKSRRECNNPSPKYGGKFCLGERVRYESCNVEPCHQHESSREDDDPRARQCSEFNNADTTWLPGYTKVSPTDVCALYCIESRTGESHRLKSRVVDGTPCTPDSYDICVNGKCLRAGCDRILGSNVRTDHCGVCGGDNSTCRVISGEFRPRSVQHGYTFVLSIPPGATNIEIQKEPVKIDSSSSSADNWLALRDQNGDYLLNGLYTVNVYERKWHYGGTTVEYSGTTSYGFERINSSRPIQNPLHLELLCVGDLHVPIIKYKFAVTSDNPYLVYQWFTEREWSPCNRPCNGEQERKSYCIATLRQTWLRDNSRPAIKQIQVKDEYCDPYVRPGAEFRVCNTHCDLEWHTSAQTGCSVKCGHGYLTRHVNCTQTFGRDRNERIYIDDLHCSHLGPKPADREECSGTECPVTYQWQFSPWSSCVLGSSRTCGPGKQTRTAVCISTTYLDAATDPHNVLHAQVGQELCSKHLPEMVTEQQCQVECPRWHTEAWSECTGICGASEQTRLVICMHGDQRVTNVYCEHVTEKPAERMPCQRPDCLLSSDKSKIDLPETMFMNHQPHDNEISSYHEPRHRYPHHHHHHHHRHKPGVWRAGEWSSCDGLHDRIRELQNQLIHHFDAPPCFDSLEKIELFRKQHYHLFELNKTLNAKSYRELVSLLHLEQSYINRNRYVACVLPSNQEVLPETECHRKTRPISEEECPMDQSLRHRMPRFNTELCRRESSSTSPTSTAIDSFYYESNQFPNRNSDQFFSKWRTGEWSECYCHPEQKTFVRKRTVVCSSLVDGHPTNDEHCARNPEQPEKPVELELCHPKHHHHSHVKLECDPYTGKPVYRTEQLPRYSMETMVNQSLFEPNTITPPPTMSPSFPTTSTLSTYSSSLPITENATILLTASDHYGTESPSITEHDGGWTEWTNWTECSATCGAGQQSREPVCPTDRVCDQQLRPSTQIRSCHRMCGFFQWHYTEWSPWSADCGTVFRTRKAQCREWTGFVVPDRYCETNHSLAIKEYRRMDDCKLVWQTGQWSECSQRCGTGIQTRDVTCHRINRYGVIDPQPLDHSNSILRKKRKQQQQQYYYSLKRKMRRKKMQINRRRSNRQSDNNNPQQWCNVEIRPPQSKTCDRGPCLGPGMTDAYVWRPAEWQMCSASCGSGYQQRKIYCYSQRTNRRVSRSRCDPKLKPEKRRQCNLRSCEVISCQDMRERGRISNDGEYELWIQGARIRIYCYGMSFMDKPIEYLILQENAFDDNYSELNAKASQCQYSPSSSSERKSTIFYKYVRFDTTTLNIYINDSRYAVIHQDSNHHSANDEPAGLSFGQASIQGCPVGQTSPDATNCHFSSGSDTDLVAMFSINLQKTGLIIDTDRSLWQITDYNVIDIVHQNIQISRNGEKIVGRCSVIKEKLPITVTVRSPKCLIGCRPFDDIIRLKIP